MSVSEPFQLSQEDVLRAGLEPGDVGAWCVLVTGCYHLLDSEAGARRAYSMFLEGNMVR